MLFLVLFFVGDSTGDDTEGAAATDGSGDRAGTRREETAGNGGYPVPPMPTGGAVRGAARPLTFESPSIRQSPTTSNAAPAREEI